MKKILLALMMGLELVAGVQAAGGGFPLDKAPVNVTDNVSLQRGARTFVNYCLSCHSAAYMRYNRLTDIGLTEQQIKDNLLITTDKVGETMKAAINPKEAANWFGAVPPDLTVIARSRAGNGGSGADYLYLSLSLPAHFLCGRCQGHGLEQPGIPQRCHAARALAAAG